MRSNSADPIAVSVDDAAEALGVSTRQIYRLLDGGEIAARYAGAKRLVDYASLREWYERLPTERAS